MKNNKFEVSLNPEMATYDPSEDDSNKPDTMAVILLFSFHALAWFSIGFVLAWSVI